MEETRGIGRYQVQLRWGIKIPLRDGICLNATAYIPRELRDPAPAIFTLTPYIGQTYHDRGMYFAAHGYPFLTVDVRGRGDSGGEFKPNINEAKDGHDVVEWLAQQTYCNGQVAMWGGSYSGYAQWATAKELPPHLSTIVPVASPSMGVDFPFGGNIASPYLMRWLTLVWGRASQDKIFADGVEYWDQRFREWYESGNAFEQLDTFLGNPSDVFQEWLRHPQPDDYWDSYNPTSEQYSRIALPVLSITGIYDGDQPGAISYYRQHLRHSRVARERHYLVIGPWDHAGTRTPRAEFGGLKLGPASVIDLPRLHLQWYAWTMQGGPKPEFLHNKVAYYVIGADRWRYAESLDSITRRVQLLYLHSAGNPTDVFSSGFLQSEPASSAPDQFVYDPRDTRLAQVEASVGSNYLVDQRMIHAAGVSQLIYHSQPFPSEMEVSGFFKLSVWLSIDRPDTDVRATVYLVDALGSAMRLSEDRIRARYRQDLRREVLIGTSEPLRYDFDHFTFVAVKISKGSRLRLVVGSNDSIYTQRNFNGGGVVSKESVKDARPVTVRLFHDGSHKSVLYVPLGDDVSEEPAWARSVVTDRQGQE
ncbi:CocE/NonD family hydrolase [Steroidobacter sp. S1-65]|uniref:CocE/NonD family hydrolase n=1 Tax=Steroidobacter gossypii TaxID=2805490 RepID=A0ABS1WZV5_9GAMM|nr:CocE/NonD family hydrolase [Steroidobacter gossypii]MBM0106516.1 CocE/NonD family hydrolase [Steroidobacter gossypii]